MKNWKFGAKRNVLSDPAPLELINGHVLIQVHAVTLLPSDVNKSGVSFSGTVLSSFETSIWQIGTKVWGHHTSGHDSDMGTQILVPEWAIHKMKTNLSFAEASTLAGPALLACHALQVAALPGSGKPRVLVHGAHTAIGTFATQVSRIMKCEVEFTCPLEFRTQCRDLGASDFVDLLDDVPAGSTLASFRGRRERNFHLVIDCLGNDPSLYENIEKYTHEHAKYITIREKAVSWTGFFKRLATSVPRDYLYLSNPLNVDNAKKLLDLVNNILGHPDFISIEIQEEYDIKDLSIGLEAVERASGFGCTVVEVSAPDSEEFQSQLRKAIQAGQMRVPVPANSAYESKNSEEQHASQENKFSLE